MATKYCTPLAGISRPTNRIVSRSDSSGGGCNQPVSTPEGITEIRPRGTPESAMSEAAVEGLTAITCSAIRYPRDSM